MHLLLRTLPIRSSLSSCPISRSIQGTTNTSIANLFPSYSLRSMHTHIPHSHTRTAYARSRNNSRPLAVALGLGSLPFLAPGRPTWLDASSAFGTDSDAFSSSAANGKNVPIIKDGKLNQAAVQQISFGAVLGLGLGVLFSMFSRMLVLLLGLGIVVWQYAARKGYNIVPVNTIQRYVKGINVRGLVQENVAFKISFGLMFALTAFGQF